MLSSKATETDGVSIALSVKLGLREVVPSIASLIDCFFENDAVSISPENSQVKGATQGP